MLMANASVAIAESENDALATTRKAARRYALKETAQALRYKNG